MYHIVATHHSFGLHICGRVEKNPLKAMELALSIKVSYKTPRF